MDIEHFKQLIAYSAIEVNASILRALIEAQKSNQNLLDFVKKHINSSLESEMESADKQTEIIFDALFRATLENIQNPNLDPPVILETLGKIQQSTQDPKLATLFISSFVQTETQNLLDKLRKEEPEALEKLVSWSSKS
ncbi:MAG: hypothetical protein Tsb0021_03910 [Chlamydiales bacterium]